jgi:hypothetical protein
MEVIAMLMWLLFISWLIFEFFLIKFIVILTKEKKQLIKHLQDVKQEISSTTDLLTMTETRQEDEEQEEWY